ncbi:DUF4430 domain-containing protein [Paenibacillus sp. NFR01]|uniref:DUF4430 domain-containing protein n=1 Tax=Paenibacillus sp. NFR01 TaxID=1566279 RepID=UPI0008D32D7A|nr:DUF4430 domain-containing protein [Paenibacillus sp. NFR01]SEU01349.1 protein of unknown function [Paenibacillus sp. NFR01]
MKNKTPRWLTQEYRRKTGAWMRPGALPLALLLAALLLASCASGGQAADGGGPSAAVTAAPQSGGADAAGAASHPPAVAASPADAAATPSAGVAAAEASAGAAAELGAMATPPPTSAAGGATGSAATHAAPATEAARPAASAAAGGQAPAATASPAAPASPPATAAAPAPQAQRTVTVSIQGDEERGQILAPTAVEAKEGETVLELLKRVTRKQKIQMEYQGSKGFAYVEGIDNLYEFDRGPESGWNYKVNGSFPGKSAGSFTLSPGDTVEWVYTLNFGADIGSSAP